MVGAEACRREQDPQFFLQSVGWHLSAASRSYGIERSPLLQDGALGLLGLDSHGAGVQNSTRYNHVRGNPVASIESSGGVNEPDSLVEDALEIPLRQGRALEVLVCLDLLCAHESLVVRDSLHALLAEGVERGGILSQIELRAD